MKCCNCVNLGKLKDEYGVPFDWCEKVCDNPDIHMERNCKHYTVASNADKIRAMTDEELAEYLCHVENDDGYAFDWLYWLKEEADT